MYKKLKIPALLVCMFFAHSTIAKETKSMTHTDRRLTHVTINGVSKARCPEGDKSCITTITLDDDGTFHHTVREGDRVGNPDPAQDPVTLDPTGYTTSNDIDIILDVVSEDLLYGEGVNILP